MESLLSILLFVAFFYLMMRFGCGAHMLSNAGGGCGHSSHSHNKTDDESSQPVISDSKRNARDPVCGMEIETARATASTKYGANTFYFCSKECYERFKERPDYFAEIERMSKRYVA
jgi:YHS domain-containing protein